MDDPYLWGILSPVLATDRITFSLKNCHCVIDFPSFHPTNARGKIEDLGAAVETGDTVYLFDIHFLPADAVENAGGAERFLITRRDEAVENGKLISDSTAMVTGYPERDFVFGDPAHGRASFRAVLYRNWLMQAAVFSAIPGMVSGADAGHFLGSFDVRP